MDKRQEQADSISDLRRLLNDYLHVLDENWAAYGDGTLNEELITFGDAVDTILRLIQPTLPELPLLTEERVQGIVLNEDEILECEETAKIGCAPYDHIAYTASLELLTNWKLKEKTAKAQRDLIADTLKKAGYEEKK